MNRLFVLILSFALQVAAVSGMAAEVAWEALAGQLPQDACPPWTAATNDSVPAISAGALRIHTTECGRNAFYLQQGLDIALPDTVVVEARLRVQSRGECVGPCGHYRDAAGIAITTGPGVGILFFVGVDQVFLTNGECNGILSASLDTDGTFHTDRLVVLPSGVVQVFHDGAPVLTGHTYASSSDHGSGPRILWGEGTSLAFGTSHWEWVRHNAHATGCATTPVPVAGEPGAAATNVGVAPNPFNPRTTISFDLPQAGAVRLAVFDVSGRRVRTLIDDVVAPGSHAVVWDGRDEAAREVGSGIYFARLDSGGRVQVMRMGLVR